MPFCNIETNIPSEKFPSDFKTKFVQFVSNLLKKPPSYVVVKLYSGLDMQCGLTDEPFILVKITSIGSFDGKNTSSFEKPFYDFFNKELPGIPQGRLVFCFEDFKYDFLLWK